VGCRARRLELGPLAADAVLIEPVSNFKFPANREKYREFCRNRRSGPIPASNQRLKSIASSQIPYATEQGICSPVSGNFSRITGNFESRIWKFGSGRLGRRVSRKCPGNFYIERPSVPALARTRIGELSGDPFAMRPFDDLPKPVFATVLRLEISVESCVIRNAAVRRQSRS
jgi:hypothetical protein